MERGVRKEKADQEVLGKKSIDFRAPISVIGQGNFLFDGDQRSDFFLGQVIQGQKNVLKLLPEGAKRQGLAERPGADAR